MQITATVILPAPLRTGQSFRAPFPEGYPNGFVIETDGHDMVSAPGGNVYTGISVSATAEFLTVINDGPTIPDGRFVLGVKVRHKSDLVQDGDGNLLATVLHRQGTLASLLALAGEPGEISVATDTEAIVTHNGIPGEATAFYASGNAAEVSFAFMSPSIQPGSGHQHVKLSSVIGTLSVISDPRGIWQSIYDEVLGEVKFNGYSRVSMTVRVIGYDEEGSAAPTAGEVYAAFTPEGIFTEHSALVGAIPSDWARASIISGGAPAFILFSHRAGEDATSNDGKLAWWGAVQNDSDVPVTIAFTISLRLSN